MGVSSDNPYADAPCEPNDNCSLPHAHSASSSIPDGKYVTITCEKYDDLVRDHDFIECLQSAGVDNWDGYQYARELYKEDHPEEDD